MVNAVSYQVAYLWTCPECLAVWQARHRPRRGASLVCAVMPEQRWVPTGGPNLPYRGCGSVSASSGRREGIAPNVSI